MEPITAGIVGFVIYFIVQAATPAKVEAKPLPPPTLKPVVVRVIQPEAKDTMPFTAGGAH